MGSAAALVLIPLLISGFLFNAIFYPLRYFSSKAEGQKLFFMAAGSGLALGAITFISVGILKKSNLVPDWIIDSYVVIGASIPVPYASLLLLTIVLGALLAWLFNGLLWIMCLRSGQSAAKAVYNRLTDKHGNSLAQLLRKAADRQKLVLLTLKSRKIYCGRILEVPSSITRDDACIEILPSFSAYRDKDTLQMGRARTDYPVIALWEARRYLSSRETVRTEFENIIRNIGEEAFDEIELKNARSTLEKDIADARSAISEVGEPPNFDPADWIKIVPVSEIESASFYDPGAYEAWFNSVNGNG